MALKEGEDYYIDKNGLLVFTAQYLLKRGFCCGNGCRHCPYPKDNTASNKKVSEAENSSDAV